MMLTAQTVTFHAELEGTAVVYLSGDVSGYDMERLKNAARYGVKSVRIRLSGARLDDAWQVLGRELSALTRRGVEVSRVFATSAHE